LSVSFAGHAGKNRHRRSCSVIIPSIIAVLPLLASGCAFDVMHPQEVPAQFQASPTSSQVLTLQNDVSVKLTSSWASKLKKGTRWHVVGRIEQGEILKTQDQVVAVTGSNMYEAAPVVNDGKLVGFFLILQNSFTPANPPKAVELVADQGS
jgi:hypothetical protein